MLSPSECKQKVRRSLSPDLLSPAYRPYYNPQLSPATGHCYVASEACYYLLGWDQDPNWKPMVAKYPGGNHWWLQHKDGTIFDPTADQFDHAPFDIPYHEGRGCGFLTKAPSKRAQELMRRVQQQ